MQRVRLSQVWHRYSDWLSFRKSLLARRVAAARPPLPSKTRSSHGVGHDVTSKRGPALAAWLTGVLADATALADPNVLGAIRPILFILPRRFIRLLILRYIWQSSSDFSRTSLPAAPKAPTRPCRRSTRERSRRTCAPVT